MNDLLKNADKVHTTKLGINRIKKNLNLGNIDLVKYCRSKLSDKKCIKRERIGIVR